MLGKSYVTHLSLPLLLKLT